ncbi:carbamate kinase [Limisalsivibrio acetivorans]|uniref:carbamate kinase n=1 Tax=Limisalsivibrio acetivorans TaxID=1304888 RepID=UPI0003B46724|nr:carbamate kinase [Limisalsivibrio acetivorans]
MKKDIVLVAIGGNSLIKDEAHKSVEDQYNALVETCTHLADIVEAGYRLVICHGNGPQVGFILRRSAIAFKTEGLHEVPLSICVADTQGSIGFQLQMALGNELRKRNLPQQTMTLVTRALVDKEDEKFKNPSKPIGSFFNEEQVKKLQSEYPDWQFVEDSGRGFRRVVASPQPTEVVEIDAVSDLIEKGYVVVAGGGGGIPVIYKDGAYEAIDAVVDKDLLSALMAEKIEAKRFIISTGVSHVYINFGKENEEKLEKISVDKIKEYIKEGHFGAGSMLPKIEAAVKFIENGGEEVIITEPSLLKDAIEHKTGTIITR